MAVDKKDSQVEVGRNRPRRLGSARDCSLPILYSHFGGYCYIKTKKFLQKVRQMIWESVYWKQELLRCVLSLKKRVNQKKWFDSSYGNVEKTIMIGFYIIRKLTEAKKVSNKLIDRNIPLISYISTGKNVTRLNFHEIDKLYKLDCPKKCSKDTLFIANQIIHSYVCEFVFDDKNGLDGVMFSSDKLKNKQLFHIDIKQIIKIFTDFGTNYPSSNDMKYNPAKGDYDVYNF
jgi:hypothetical protein